MNTQTRRQFLGQAAAATGGLALAAALPRSTWSQAAGANGDLRVGIVGIRSKGHQHIEIFRKLQGVRVAALCDVDRSILDREVAAFTKRNEKVAAFTDLRKLYDSKDIDAVVIATPNHWHSLAAIWACQAGKDVYVEKPVSHNVWEGRKVVEAAQKYGRIVQGGTQSRSSEGLAEAVEYVRSGKLGRIKAARGFCYKRRASIGHVTAPTPIPPEVDYNLWCGPAPMKPLMRKQLHYDWHWFWDTGNGDIGNQGIHEMDVCRWFLGEPRIAPRVIGWGGRFGYEDDAETPNTEIAWYDYATAPLIFEVRGLPMKPDMETMDHYRGIRIGVVIECEGGYFAGGGGGGWVYDDKGERVKQFSGEGGGGHPQNFVDAVRARKTELLKAPVLETHISSALCHLGNISYRLGRETPPDAIRESLKPRGGASDSFERFQEHLRVHGVDLKKTPATLGPMLTFDPQKEQFEGFWAGRSANRQVHPDYRAPFVVPDKV